LPTHTKRSGTYSADYLASLPPSVRESIIAKMPTSTFLAWAKDYEFWARASQREPTGNWHKWLLLGGRGAGKTWTGANVTNRRARLGHDAMILLGAATPSDARDIMVQGPAGILATSPADFTPHYAPSKQRVVWPNGVIGSVRSGAEPDRFRGLNSSFAWLDEISSWQYPQASFDNALLGLRVGEHPQVVLTTTPKPIPLIRSLLKESQQAASTCIVTTDSSHANRANLADSWWTDVVERYEGTTLGRQEIYAELLTDIPGALWRYSLIEHNRVGPDHPALTSLGRLVIGVDPAVTSSADSNETGIIAAALGTGAWKGHAFILRDVSGRYPASRWPEQVANAYRALSADRIVCEVNNGGDLVEEALRVVDPSLAITKVTASRGKRIRAEPVAALYEQERVHHVGTFGTLEDQMCTFIPDERSEHDLLTRAGGGISTSPDRVDALVWALSHLLIGPQVFVV